jgi:hypothetical protein
MGEKQQHNRRSARIDKHETSVMATLQGVLVVQCSCGFKLGGRYEDRMVMTLSDILAILRQHQSELNSPA